MANRAAERSRRSTPRGVPVTASRSRRELVIPIALYLFALALRITYLLQLRQTPLFHSPGLDSAYYLSTARAIAKGEGIGIDVYFMGPLYSYALALIGWTVDFAVERALLVQSLIGSAGPPLLYLLARRFVGRWAAISAGLAMAAYGMLILYDNLFLMEWLLTLLLILVLLVLTGARAESRSGRFLLAGALLGVAALGRASVLFFAPLALFWIAIGAGPWPAPATARRWRWGLAFAIGLALAIAPATVRNLVVGKDRVLVSSNGGLNLFIGNNPIGRGTYLPLDQIARAVGVGGAENAAIDVSWMITDPSGRRVAEAARGRSLAPSEVSDFWAERAFAAMRADPGRTLRIFGRKLLLVWNATEIPQIEDPALYRDLVPFLRGPLVRFGWVAPLALLGIAFALRSGAERRRWSLISLFALAFTLSIAVFFVTARYRVPIAPVVLLLAAYASEEMVAIARRSWRAVILPVVALVGCASIVHLDLVRFDRSAAYVSLGIALAEEGRNDEAITAFQRAIALAPGDPVAPMNLGTAYLKAGRNAEAAATFRTGATRFPRTMSLWRGLGESEALLGNAAAAAAAFRQAAMIEPRDPYLWFRVGGAEFVAGRVDSARAALARGDALDPGNEAIRDLRARMEAEIAKRSGGGP